MMKAGFATWRVRYVREPKIYRPKTSRAHRLIQTRLAEAAGTEHMANSTASNTGVNHRSLPRSVF